MFWSKVDALAGRSMQKGRKISHLSPSSHPSTRQHRPPKIITNIPPIQTNLGSISDFNDGNSQ